MLTVYNLSCEIFVVSIYLYYSHIAFGCFLFRKGNPNYVLDITLLFFQNIKQKVPPDIHTEEETLHPDEAHESIEDSLAEESLLIDTGVTDIDSEIKYQTDSENDSLEIQDKLSPVAETHTNLKRAYV